MCNSVTWYGSAAAPPSAAARTTTALRAAIALIIGRAAIFTAAGFAAIRAVEGATVLRREARAIMVDIVKCLSVADHKETIVQICWSTNGWFPPACLPFSGKLPSASFLFLRSSPSQPGKMVAFSKETYCMPNLSYPLDRYDSAVAQPVPYEMYGTVSAEAVV